MRAYDREGHGVLLGTRTMTCANASATLPFGTIDTPLQGGVASGRSYVNFGWALTPQPKTIPCDGSTIHVLVDGVDVGPADYNHSRLGHSGAVPRVEQHEWCGWLPHPRYDGADQRPPHDLVDGDRRPGRDRGDWAAASSPFERVIGHCRRDVRARAD